VGALPFRARCGGFGLFTFQGKWIEGDITQADTNMLRFVGGAFSKIAAV
jgi:hypothetical protein